MQRLRRSQFHPHRRDASLSQSQNTSNTADSGSSDVSPHPDSVTTAVNQNTKRFLFLVSLIFAALSPLGAQDWSGAVGGANLWQNVDSNEDSFRSQMNLQEGFFHFGQYFLAWRELLAPPPIFDGRAANPPFPHMLGWASWLALAVGIVTVVATFVRRSGWTASRYWALRTLLETDYDGPSPIVDPDLHLLDPDVAKKATAHLRGAALDDDLLQFLYVTAAANLLGAPNDTPHT